MISPSARTKQWLEARGWLVGTVERRPVPAKPWITQDLFGFADLFACMPLRGAVLIQATSGNNHAARRTKIEAEPRARHVLGSGIQVWVFSWTKGGPEGKRKLWRPRIEVARIQDESVVWADHEEVAAP